MAAARGGGDGRVRFLTAARGGGRCHCAGRKRAPGEHLAVCLTSALCSSGNVLAPPIKTKKLAPGPRV